MGLLPICFLNMIIYPGSLSEDTDSHLVMFTGLGDAPQWNFRSISNHLLICHVCSSQDTHIQSLLCERNSACCWSHRLKTTVAAAQGLMSGFLTHFTDEETEALNFLVSFSGLFTLYSLHWAPSSLHGFAGPNWSPTSFKKISWPL